MEIEPAQVCDLKKREKVRKGKVAKPVNAGCGSYTAFRWCDMRCEHASFPDEEAVDGSGTCRTFQAIFCKKLKRYVAKNAPCSARHGARRPKPNW